MNIRYKFEIYVSYIGSWGNNFSRINTNDHAALITIQRYVKCLAQTINQCDMIYMLVNLS